jgi:hypothetical protein
MKYDLSAVFKNKILVRFKNDYMHVFIYSVVFHQAPQYKTPHLRT